MVDPVGDQEFGPPHNPSPKPRMFNVYVKEKKLFGCVKCSKHYFSFICRRPSCSSWYQYCWGVNKVISSTSPHRCGWTKGYSDLKIENYYFWFLHVSMKWYCMTNLSIARSFYYFQNSEITLFTPQQYWLYIENSRFGWGCPNLLIPAGSTIVQYTF
jgi:hypothetical protein